jgi:predicted nucleic acid-binding protein
VDRVFLDANVLFSAAHSAQNGLLRLWSLPATELLTSAYAAEEARRNLSDPDAELRLDQLLHATVIVPDAPATMGLPAGVQLPAKDIPILLAAIAAQATHLITGDRRHFGPLFGQSVNGVLVLPPADYLAARP